MRTVSLAKDQASQKGVKVVSNLESTVPYVASHEINIKLLLTRAISLRVVHPGRCQMCPVLSRSFAYCESTSTVVHAMVVEERYDKLGRGVACYSEYQVLIIY